MYVKHNTFAGEPSIFFDLLIPFNIFESTQYNLHNALISMLIKRRRYDMANADG